MEANEKKLAAEARNAYARKWRAANPDKVRAYNENYWIRRAKKEKGILKNEEMNSGRSCGGLKCMD